MAYDLDAEDRHRLEVMRETTGAYRRTFRPVVVRERHDGWTCERQAHFIEMLGESGCVTEACAAVGMSTNSAYRLKARYDAVDFRLAWEAALDMAVGRVEDGVLARAINGVAVPHYYQGEQIGEHRRYDERLALFLLRYRKPWLYGRHLDRAGSAGHPEADAERFAVGVERVLNDDSRTLFEDEDAEAAAAHLARDTTAVADAQRAAERAAAKAATARARAEETGDETDGRIARETADWAAGLSRDADEAAARVARTTQWVAHANAVVAAREAAAREAAAGGARRVATGAARGADAGAARDAATGAARGASEKPSRTNQAGGGVPQPSQPSAHEPNRMGSPKSIQRVNSRKRARRRKRRMAGSG